MSIKYISELIFDIYIKKYLISDINFDSKEDIEKYLKNLFKILNNKYNLKIEGFYNIDIYIDDFYGIVFRLEKENIGYYEYYKNQIDMRLITIKTNFLYEVNDIPNNILDKVEIINKKNNLYLKIKKELTNIEMMNLIENSRLVYN